MIIGTYEVASGFVVVQKFWFISSCCPTFLNDSPLLVLLVGKLWFVVSPRPLEYELSDSPTGASGSRSGGAATGPLRKTVENPPWTGVQD